MQLKKVLQLVLVIALAVAVFFCYVTLSNPKTIYEAAKRGDEDAVKRFLDAGVDVDACETRLRETALNIAVVHGHIHIMELLVEAGADIDKKAKFDTRPLYCAAMYGQREAAEFLILKGADVNARRSGGYTALHGATREAGLDVGLGRGDPAGVAQLLIDNGANINAQDSIGETPLHMAVSNATPEVLRILLAAGADTKIESGGLTPLELAEAFCGRGPRVGGSPKLRPKYEECAKILKEHSSR